ncbi:hypothetical protein F5Y09DRAFT_339899 [Xylaria sp. FL1042]|nr:hypothetical protein F5Y09DRAFT_339899 [Xylaria sp. FL1042]
MAPTDTTDRHLVLVGVGPGIGRSVACLFASKRYNNITLISRRAEQLKIEQAEVEVAARPRPVKVRTYAVDVADSGALSDALVDAETAFGKPECVYFNAARVIPSQLLNHDVKEIEYDFRLTVSALYVTAQWAMPSLQDLAKVDTSAQPALVVTGGVLHVEPDPKLFALRGAGVLLDFGIAWTKPHFRWAALPEFQKKDDHRLDEIRFREIIDQLGLDYNIRGTPNSDYKEKLRKNNRKSYQR